MKSLKTLTISALFIFSSTILAQEELEIHSNEVPTISESDKGIEHHAITYEHDILEIIKSDTNGITVTKMDFHSGIVFLKTFNNGQYKENVDYFNPFKSFSADIGFNEFNGMLNQDVLGNSSNKTGGCGSALAVMVAAAGSLSIAIANGSPQSTIDRFKDALRDAMHDVGAACHIQ